jgi:hypothetical protein
MSTEQNKAIARRSIEELWNKCNVGVIDELFAENYVDHSTVPPWGKAADRCLWKEGMGAILAGAPSDLHIATEDQIAEGDKVVTCWTLSFTHTAAFLGVAPTGRRITWAGNSIHHLAGGKIIAEWSNWDDLRVYRYLGRIA